MNANLDDEKIVIVSRAVMCEGHVFVLLFLKKEIQYSQFTIPPTIE